MNVRVARARLEQVQPLAAAFHRDATREGTVTEAPLPTGALFWLATDAEHGPVGYAAGVLRPEGVVLGPVYVRPAHRRHGTGLRLLCEIERWAAEARLPVVEVSVASDNQVGVRFLEAAGYVTRRVLMARVAPRMEVVP